MSTTSKQFFASPQAFVIITGASRGFGETIALEFVKQYRDQFAETNSSKNDAEHNNLTMVLIARSIDRLKQLSERLREIDSRVSIHAVRCDLSQSNEMVKLEQELDRLSIFDNAKQEIRSSHYTLVHNAGSLGDPQMRCIDIRVRDHAKRDSDYRLNLFSAMELTALFVRRIERQDAMIHIINISSLIAIQPFDGLMDYGTMKAAREAFFRSFVHEAQQSKSKSTVRVLQYAPGPLKTDMFTRLETASLVAEQFRKIAPLTTEQSAKKMIKILCEDAYESGAHVDYYDDES